MHVSVFDPNHLLIGTPDGVLLRAMRSKMGGTKVREKNQIIVPLRSGPKIDEFTHHERANYSPGVREAIDKIASIVARREKMADVIKGQYQSGNITFKYDYKGQYAPLSHQKVMYNMAAHMDVCALLAEPGTCKTGPYLWAIDTRIQRGQVQKCLVITQPFLKANVLGEMRVQVPHMSGVILDDKIQANKILNKSYKVKKKNVDYHVYIANYESMYSLVELIPDGYFQMVVLDEAHRIGSAQSRQTNAIIDKFEFVPYKVIVTGSLHSNNVMSFYSPFRFLGPDVVPYADFYGCREHLMYPVDDQKHIWVPTSGSESIVRDIVGKISVCFTKEECLDLPDIIYERITFSLNDSQMALYNKMKNEMIAQIDGMCAKCSKSISCDMSCKDTVEAKNALVLLSKLRQITCGFYIQTQYDVNQETGVRTGNNAIITLDSNAKLSILMNVLNNIPDGKKTIIWTTYTHAVRTIRDAIADAYGEDSVLTCYGDDDSFAQVEKFKSPEKQWMVANQSKGGVGLNIQFSSYQVYFNNSYSWVQREQAEARQHRQGQKDKVTVYDTVAVGTIDEIILDRLNAKESLAESLLQLAKVMR